MADTIRQASPHSSCGRIGRLDGDDTRTDPTLITKKSRYGADHDLPPFEGVSRKSLPDSRTRALPLSACPLPGLPLECECESAQQSSLACDGIGVPVSTLPPQPLVIAVVATHQPDDRVVHNVSVLRRQVERVIVVDDGSGPAAASVLADLGRMTGVSVVQLSENRGIAAALNAGVATARQVKPDALLTLDQDSEVAADYVANAAAALQRLRGGKRRLTMVAAGVQSGATVRPVRFRDRGDQLTPTLEAIQSGLVVPFEVFDRIGEFDESLFIDCVDTDFTLRAAAAGIPTYLARGCAIKHPLGRTIDTGALPVTRSGRRSFAFHPAWRRYYISRNRAIVLIRHGLRRPDWAIAGLAGEAVQLARSLVFGPHKVQQVVAVVVGFADAARGRRGRLGGKLSGFLGASA